MREKFTKFMYGRYGADQFSKFLLGVFCGVMILNLFVRSSLLSAVIVLLMIYLYFRMFSKNHAKRYNENQKFLYYKGKATAFVTKEKTMLEYRKTHHVYTCPQCKQKIKIPKGKGKVCVTCPSCKTEFIKKS